MDALAETAVAIREARVRIAAWLAVTALALALGAVVGLERSPVVTPNDPTPPHFALGPVWGSVTQSIDFPSGPLETVTIWTRSKGTRAIRAEAQLLRSVNGPPVRAAMFEAPLGADLQPTRIPFAPIDLPPGTLVLRIVSPEPSSAALYVGATRHNVYPDGQLADRLGHAPVDIDLAFVATGNPGALHRLRTQASEAPFYLAVGVAVALLAGAAAGRGAWSTLQRERFGRLVAVAVGCGIAAAAILGPLLGPVMFL